MHIIINKTQLTNSLSRLKALAMKGDEYSKCTKISVSSENVCIAACNSEMNYVIRMHCESQREGECIIQTESLLSVCDAMNTEDISIIKINDSTIEILGEKGYKFRLFLIANNFYTGLPEFTEGDSPNSVLFEFKSDELASNLSKISYAQSADPLRFYLNGIYCDPILLENGRINCTFAATDSRRLAIMRMDAESHVGELTPFLLSTAVVNQIIDIAADGECANTIQLRLYNDRKNIFIRCIGETTSFEISATTIQATYPDYKKVIPTASNYIFEIDRKKILSGINAASKLLDQSTPKLIIDYAENNDYLSVYVRESAKGTADIQIPIDFNSAETLIFALNYKYILDAVKHISSDKITIIANGAQEPIQILPHNASNKVPSENHIIMPMMIEKF